MNYNSITMNLECTKKITNGNRDGLLFTMYNNATAKIVEMVMVMMICCNGDG
jgi:hypothetical protein